MKFLIVALACFILATNLEGSRLDSTPGYHDRLCGANLTNLWLDVVAVVDNSIGMTNAGLDNILANLQSVFTFSRIGVDPNEPRTSRLGIVTYNKEATTEADLSQFKSVDDLYNILPQYIKLSSEETSYLSTGLDAARQLLSRTSSDGRDHYKKVVIVYASAFEGTGAMDPLPASQRLHSDGTHVITVAYDQDGDGTLAAELSQIASAGSAYSNTDGGQLLGEVQGDLMQVNCFCADLWFQFTSNTPNPYRYGTCVQAAALPAVWRAAQMSCRNRFRDSYLVNEYSQDKHDFVLRVAKNATGFSEPFTYHIGLSYSAGVWQWNQPLGLPAVNLGPDFTDWQPTYPRSDSTLNAAQNQQRSPQDLSSVEWVNIKYMGASSNYLCETVSCDTDNYCSAADVKA